MGPQDTRNDLPQLGYHLTVDAHGVITKVQPDFDYPNGDMGAPWVETNVRGVRSVAHFISYVDFDRLVIHTPKE